MLDLGSADFDQFRGAISPDEAIDVPDDLPGHPGTTPTPSHAQEEGPDATPGSRRPPWGLPSGRQARLDNGELSASPGGAARAPGDVGGLHR